MIGEIKTDEILLKYILYDRLLNENIFLKQEIVNLNKRIKELENKQEPKNG